MISVERYTATPRLMVPAFGLGVLGLVLTAVGAFVGDAGAAAHSYLIAFAYWVGIAVASLIMVAVFHTAKAKWMTVLRRAMETMAISVPIFAVLFLGLIPGMKPGTGTLGTTFAWGIMVFVVYNAIGFKKHGVVGYLKSFLPSGTPWWLVWLIYPLEVISHFLRPFTLGVRLYANMYAGHIVLGIFGIFVVMMASALSPVTAIVGSLSLVMQIIMYAFEVFVAFIQAYVFAILTTVYINGAIHTH
jgi:ATP synthase subunit 6